MKKSGWYIVKFINENTIETIPSSWMINFEKCVWPTTLPISKLSLAIKNNLKNSKDWKYCKIKVLCKKLLTNFNEASKMTNDFLTQSTTDAETYEPKIVFKKRKKNMKIREKTDSSASSSNSESDDTGLPPLPKLTSNLRVYFSHFKSIQFFYINDCIMYKCNCCWLRN